MGGGEKEMGGERGRDGDKGGLGGFGTKWLVLQDTLVQ